MWAWGLVCLNPLILRLALGQPWCVAAVAPHDQVCECSRVNERIYRPVAIRSDAELTLLKMAFMRAS